MTLEANKARYDISELLESGKSFHEIAALIGSRKTPLTDFYSGKGRD